MASVVEEQIQSMTQRIVRECDPLEVLLFGSWARGDAASDSDVDLLVILPDGTRRRPAAIALRRALDSGPLACDVLVVTPEDVRRRGRIAGSVLRAALREGKVLYARP